MNIIIPHRNGRSTPFGAITGWASLENNNDDIRQAYACIRNGVNSQTLLLKAYPKELVLTYQLGGASGSDFTTIYSLTALYDIFGRMNEHMFEWDQKTNQTKVQTIPSHILERFSAVTRITNESTTNILSLPTRLRFSLIQETMKENRNPFNIINIGSIFGNPTIQCQD